MKPRLLDRDAARMDVLARYNAERGRGLLHDREWVAFMADEQRWFDEEYMPATWTRMGYELVVDAGPLSVYQKILKDPFWKRLLGLVSA